jgi:hypothetical protein
MMNITPEVVAQLERILCSVEILLPKAVKLCINRWSKQLGQEIPWSEQRLNGHTKRPNATAEPPINFRRTGLENIC